MDLIPNGLVKTVRLNTLYYKAMDNVLGFLLI